MHGNDKETIQAQIQPLQEKIRDIYQPNIDSIGLRMHDISENKMAATPQQ